MQAICRYCDKPAIGVEVDRYDDHTEDINVCRDCAHVGTTVYLFEGGKWRKALCWANAHGTWRNTRERALTTED